MNKTVFESKEFRISVIAALCVLLVVAGIATLVHNANEETIQSDYTVAEVEPSTPTLLPGGVISTTGTVEENSFQNRLARLCSSDIATLRSTVTAVVFEDLTGSSATDTDYVDVSVAQDKSALAYFSEEDSGVLYIACYDGTVSLNAYSGYYFYGFEALRRVDFSGVTLLTDNLTDTIGMFAFCSTLSEIDVSGWNMENVTDCKGMFADCNSLTEVDISSWTLSDDALLDNLFRNNTMTVYYSDGSARVVTDSYPPDTVTFVYRTADGDEVVSSETSSEEASSAASSTATSSAATSSATSSTASTSSTTTTTSSRTTTSAAATSSAAAASSEATPSETTSEAEATPSEAETESTTTEVEE